MTFQTEMNKDYAELERIFNEMVKPHGYSFSVKKNIIEKKSRVIWQAIPIGLIFLGVFILLQKSGILNFGIGGGVTPVTSFMIGLIASVSSCLAIVGGLVLSLTAKASQDNVSDTRNIILFHIARVF